MKELSLRLREETAQAHEDAERSDFVSRFMGGQISRSSYIAFLQALHALYAALEAGMERNASHPAIAPIYFPELRRTAPLEADLQHLGASPEGGPEAGRAYAAHLEKLATEQPELLVAHAYVRYLGDLSGGQVLKKAAARTFGLENDAGLAFYLFPEIESIKDFKDLYRSRLNGLPLDAAAQDAVVQEAMLAFRMNGDIFVELDGIAAAAG